MLRSFARTELCRCRGLALTPLWTFPQSGVNSTVHVASPTEKSTHNQFQSTRWLSSSSSSSSSSQPFPTGQGPPPFFPVYVHHVSQTVLQHLQDKHASWLTRYGLDRGLRLNANGTFVMLFPSSSPTTTTTATADREDAGRIWTSYDLTTKQHWLSIYRRNLVGRFLLKDDASFKRQQTSATFTIGGAEHAIRGAVDQLAHALDAEEKRRRTSSSPSWL